MITQPKRISDAIRVYNQKDSKSDKLVIEIDNIHHGDMITNENDTLFIQETENGQFWLGTVDTISAEEVACHLVELFKVARIDPSQAGFGLIDRKRHYGMYTPTLEEAIKLMFQFDDKPHMLPLTEHYCQ